VALTVAVSVRTLLCPATHTVFPVFATSAERWWADRPLYGKTEELDHFRYPPVFALAMTPFSGLGLRAGGVLWGWGCIAVYLAGLRSFARHALPVDWSRARTAAFLVLGALGALRGLWNGQSNALVVGLLLLGSAHLARERCWRAGWLLAGAVAIKLTPLAPALLLCALWPRRLAPRLALALLAFAVVPFLTRPPAAVVGHYVDWVTHLRESGGERWPGFRDAWTVWQVARHAAEGRGGPIPLEESLDCAPYRALQLLTALAALAWCLCQRRGADRRWLVTATLAMGCAWLMLFGPAVEYPTYVFLAPVLAWAFLDRRAWPAGRALTVPALVLILFLGWGSITRPFAEALPLVLTALPVGTALFTAWLVAYARVAGREEPARAAEVRLQLRGRARRGPSPVKAR
jgi:hypothetical protein